jgi:pimeloyl-ACP methyl ester carboxylesterase
METTIRSARTGSGAVFGHSYGGLVALELARGPAAVGADRLRAAPQAVAGLVRAFLAPAQSIP